MELEKWKQQLLYNKDLFIGENTARRSAVLIPLVEVDGEWCVLFEVRSSTMRFQPEEWTLMTHRCYLRSCPRCMKSLAQRQIQWKCPIR